MAHEQDPSVSKATRLPEGSKLYAVAGRPTRAQLIVVFGEKGPKMSWAERAAAGVPAEQFQEALAEKIKSRDGNTTAGDQMQFQAARASSGVTTPERKRQEILTEETEEEMGEDGQLTPVLGEASQIAEELAYQSNAAELADLDEQVFRWHERGEQANLELGRVCIRVKDRVGHGQWQRSFAQRYAPRGLVLRTVERYMKRAEQTDMKNVNLTVFPKATDEQANQVREANAQAMVAREGLGTTHSEVTVPPPTDVENVTAPRKLLPRPAGIFWIPLIMTGAEKDSTEKLMADTKNWPTVEKQIMDLLRLFHSASEPYTSEVIIPDTAEAAQGHASPGPVPQDNGMTAPLSSKAATA
jgi:hypothetical protein